MFKIISLNYRGTISFCQKTGILLPYTYIFLHYNISKIGMCLIIIDSLQKLTVFSFLTST